MATAGSPPSGWVSTGPRSAKNSARTTLSMPTGLGRWRTTRSPTRPRLLAANKRGRLRIWRLMGTGRSIANHQDSIEQRLAFEHGHDRFLSQLLEVVAGDTARAYDAARPLLYL